MKFSKMLKGVIGRISKIFRKRSPRKSKKQRILPAESPALLPQKILQNQTGVVEPRPAIQSLQEFSQIQLSPNTQRAYKKDLQDFFAWLKTQDLWENWNQNLQPQNIAQYREHLKNDRNLSKSTITRRLAVLKSFFKYACAQDWMLKNPAELVKSYPQNQESKTGFLNEEQIYQVLDFLKYRGDERLSWQLQKVSIETLLMLGLRRSEACSIRLGQIEYNDEQYLLRVKGKGDRDRLLPLPSKLLESWEAWIRRIYREHCPTEGLLKNPSTWLLFFKQNFNQALLVSTRAKSFETALSSSELAFIVRKVSRHAGISQRVSPHMLRASAITFALDKGASHRSVQQMAGWTSPLMITRYDKRRNDPKLSAIHNLSYAQKSAMP